MIKILFIGDIVGSPGRQAIKELVPKIVKREKIDFVIANGENAAGGSGITPALLEELLGYGVDAITSGDHIWKRKEIIETIDSDKRLLRPANFPEGTPGFGSNVYEAKNKIKIGVINLEGRTFMNPKECPFKAAIRHIDEIKKKTPIIVVDMHAEATSEKIALGWFLDGIVSACVGTHTHVQTADERILPKGTAYITDLGMTGPYDSVLGRKQEQIIARFITQMPTSFEMATENIQLHGAIVEVEEKTGKAKSIKRLQEKL